MGLAAWDGSLRVDAGHCGTPRDKRCDAEPVGAERVLAEDEPSTRRTRPTRLPYMHNRQVNSTLGYVWFGFALRLSGS